MADAALRPDLSHVLERITDGFFALDAQWRIAYINAQARKLLHAPKDCIGLDWLEVFPKARGRLFEREYLRAMDDQRPVQFVEYSATAERWLEVKAYPARDGLSVYFRDVTSRVEAQREVERASARQQALIDFGRAALGGAGFEHTLDRAAELLRDVLEANVVEIFRYDRVREVFIAVRSSGWRNGAVFSLAHPPLDHLASVLRTGEPFVSTDLRIDPRARSLAQLDAAGVLSCAANLIGGVEAPVGAIALFHNEPHTFSLGEVRFVQSLSQSIAEIATSLESSNMMSQILESIHDAFVAVDGDLRITYVNELMERAFGASPGEAIGRPLEQYAAQLEESERVVAAYKRALLDQRAATVENRQNGRWYETRLYPFGRGVAGYVRDITARKDEQQRVLELAAELERRVAERTMQLELANKELESFSYSVSHDLRAPLRAIDGFSQALLEDYGSAFDERAQGYLDRVRRAAQRMSQLIDALLKLAKVARTPIARSNVNVSAIASSVAGDLRESDPERNVEFVVEPGLTAYAEPHLVHIVAQNLLGNAWKFTRNTPNAQVYVGKNSEGEFYVRDNGAGFDPSYAGKLFGAFARLHAAEEYEGTGIGLATVARIVHRHGGTIRAEGAVGAGASFYFTLPEEGS
jgi:PAS domain S-box-containing protein